MFRPQTFYFDASFKAGNHSRATGLVVRDSEGGLILARARWVNHPMSSLVMEANAVLDDIRLALDRGYQRVEIKTDAQEVIKLMEDPCWIRSCIATIRQEVEELRENFNV